MGAGIGDGERPAGRGGHGIAVRLPRREVLVQHRPVRDPLGQHLPLEHADLELGHVSPGAVYGGEAQRDLAGDPERLCGRKGGVQRLKAMDVEIVADDDQALGIGELDINQLAQDMGEVDAATVIGGGDVAPAELRRRGQEEAGAAAPGILGVLAGRLARGHRQRGSQVVLQGGAGFIETDQ